MSYEDRGRSLSSENVLFDYVKCKTPGCFGKSKKVHLLCKRCVNEKWRIENDKPNRRNRKRGQNELA